MIKVLLLLTLVTACTTINIGGAPGFMGHRESGLSHHMGSQIGATVNGDRGVAVEAFYEPRFVSTTASFGLRTSYFGVSHKHDDGTSTGIGGLLFTPTAAVSVRGFALHGGVGALVQGGRAIRGLVGTTLWPFARKGFGYGVNLELSIVRGTGDEPGDVSATHLALTLGLELGL